MLMIFSITKGKEGMHLRGHYDGREFIPVIGFCNSIDELYEYDYIEIFTVEGLTKHIPKRFFGDLETKFKREYTRQFGESEKQMTLF